MSFIDLGSLPDGDMSRLTWFAERAEDRPLACTPARQHVSGDAAKGHLGNDSSSGSYTCVVVVGWRRLSRARFFVLGFGQQPISFRVTEVPEPVRTDTFEGRDLQVLQRRERVARPARGHPRLRVGDRGRQNRCRPGVTTWRARRSARRPPRQAGRAPATAIFRGSFDEGSRAAMVTVCAGGAGGPDTVVVTCSATHRRTS